MGLSENTVCVCYLINSWMVYFKISKNCFLSEQSQGQRNAMPFLDIKQQKFINVSHI